MESEDAFVKQLFDSRGSFPPYFLTLGEMNRRGPQVVHGDSLPALAAAEVAGLRETGAEIVDVRPVDAFAAAHVSGSVSIPLRPVFATWFGWLLPAAKPLIVVRNADQDPAKILWKARKIGYNHLVGELDGGIASWTQTGHPTGSIPLIHRRTRRRRQRSTSGKATSSRLGTSPAPPTSSSGSWSPAPSPTGGAASVSSTAACLSRPPPLP